MAAHILRLTPATFDWRRVGAFSTTLAAHAAALALILMPLAAPIERNLQRAIEVTFVEAPPPPKIPPPPEPEPLRKPPRPTAIPPTHSPPRPPTPVAVAPAPSPIRAPVATTPAPPVAAPAPPVATAGETRRLAYDGELHARYPAAALRAREQGTVLLRVLVDAQGRVDRVEIARSSGHPKLDAAARDAVSKARFKPVLSGGEAIPAWGLVPIEFRLDRV